MGAAGSGGSIYLKADNLVINSGVSISADGGPAVPWISAGGNADATDGGGQGQPLEVVAVSTWKAQHRS